MTEIGYGEAICPRCCLPIQGPPHHSRDLNDGVSFVCEYADDDAAARLDTRFSASTNRSLSALNHYVIGLAPRVSVSQHSQLLKRIETVVAAALSERSSEPSSHHQPSKGPDK